MSASAEDRLRRLLGADALMALRQRLRRRYERAALDGGIDTFRIDKLTAQEHAALAALQGRPQRFAGSMTVDVGAIDAALRQAGIAGSLREALERLEGPITHLASARSRSRTQWKEVVDGCGHPGLAAFLQRPAGVGLLKRLSSQDAAAATDLRRRAQAVLGRLPANGVTRAQLAAQVLGDAHGLDANKPAATLVLAVWRNLVADGLPEANGEGAHGADEDKLEPEIRGEKARDVWARAGVLVNELARPAMFLNLPVRSPERYAPAGEPAYVSLRRLLRAPPEWAVDGQVVYVCENPNLLAIAADQLGPNCAPLVCTDGMPAAAQGRLLTQLARAGAHLSYHGDFDWPGLSIGNHVMQAHGARPWRFGASDYLAALSATRPLGHLLKGREVTASWDAALTSAMRAHRLGIAEEGVAASLMPDLASRVPGG